MVILSRKLKSSLIFVLGFFCLCQSEISAQLIELPNIKAITQKDGLPIKVVSHIVQDNDGFIWVGGPDGLARYDGYTFTLVSFAGRDSSLNVNDGVTALAIAPDNIIWVGHLGYITRLNPKTLEVHSSTVKGAESTLIQKIFCDSQGRVWCFAENVGLYVSDGKSEFKFAASLYNFPKKAVGPTSSYNQLGDMYEGADHSVWIASANGLYQIAGENADVKIEVATPFWKQLWFRVAMVGLGLLGVYVVYRLRLARWPAGTAAAAPRRCLM